MHNVYVLKGRPVNNGVAYYQQTWSQGHHMQGQGQGLDLQGQGQGLNSGGQQGVLPKRI